MALRRMMVTNNPLYRTFVEDAIMHVRSLPALQKARQPKERMVAGSRKV
ncbi:MAG TPA: hypothetical protein VKK79_18770 [Candidatus Lokiarchaeia archaeon]|nr:hypothetical protein [Candidatus Lokiarchaeia archaeon]